MLCLSESKRVCRNEFPYFLLVLNNDNAEFSVSSMAEHWVVLFTVCLDAARTVWWSMDLMLAEVCSDSGMTCIWSSCGAV